jgi:hypothetical protein
MARSTNRPSNAARLCAALLAVSLLGACQDGGRGEGSGATTTTESSMEGYAARVTDAVGRFRSAIAQVAAAESYKDLRGQVSAAVVTMRSTTAGLRNLSGAPAGTKSAHDRLVAVMTDLQFEVIGASGAVQNQQLCSASAVIAALNKSGTPGKLDAAAQELSAVTGGRFKATEVVPVAKPAIQRPPSGTVVRGRLTGPRRNYITIDNKDDVDVVLTLGKGKEGRTPYLSFYVKRDSKVTIRGIPNGTYRSHGTDGKDWDGKQRLFTRECSFWKYKGKETWGVAPDYTVGWSYSFGAESDDGEGGSEFVPPDDAVSP